jgi:FixJ family two-component response regulator
MARTSAAADKPTGLRHSGEFSVAMERSIVAIVDDDPEILSLMASLLSTAGYRTELFASGKAFLHAAAASEADCLAVDIQLGDISGLELVQHLAVAGYRFPTIFMTGLDDETIHNQAIAFGCVAYLQKPFPANLLLQAISRATGNIAAPDR